MLSFTDMALEVLIKYLDDTWCDSGVEYILHNGKATFIMTATAFCTVYIYRSANV